MKMTFPTPVNSQITDAVTQANQKEPREVPNVAMGELFLATSEALANAAHQATTRQQQNSMTTQAETAMGIGALYSINANTAKTTSEGTETLLNPPHK
jgi:hypothetical protein